MGSTNQGLSDCLAQRIIDEMKVRYAEDGIKASDVLGDLSDDDDGDDDTDLSDAEDADLWDQSGPYAGL